jgi:hypothetical protein
MKDWQRLNQLAAANNRSRSMARITHPAKSARLKAIPSTNGYRLPSKTKPVSINKAEQQIRGMTIEQRYHLFSHILMLLAWEEYELSEILDFSSMVFGGEPVVLDVLSGLNKWTVESLLNLMNKYSVNELTDSPSCPCPHLPPRLTNIPLSWRWNTIADRSQVIGFLKRIGTTFHLFDLYLGKVDYRGLLRQAIAREKKRHGDVWVITFLDLNVMFIGSREGVVHATERLIAIDAARLLHQQLYDDDYGSIIDGKTKNFRAYCMPVEIFINQDFEYLPQQILS